MCNERLQWRTAEHNTGECNCGVTTPRCFRSTETFIRSSHHTSSPASASGNPVQPRREVQLRRFTRVPACVVVTSQWVLHVVAHMAQEGEALTGADGEPLSAPAVLSTASSATPLPEALSFGTGTFAAAVENGDNDNGDERAAAAVPPLALAETKGMPRNALSPPRIVKRGTSSTSSVGEAARGVGVGQGVGASQAVEAFPEFNMRPSRSQVRLYESGSCWACGVMFVSSKARVLIRDE